MKPFILCLLLTALIGCATPSSGVREKLDSMYTASTQEIIREFGYPDNQFVDDAGKTVYQYSRSKEASSPKTYYRNYGMGSVSTYGGGDYVKHCRITLIFNKFGLARWYAQGNSCNL